ncbi:hypothetical protein F511_07033 [Dorcoceras hygrometricum]|uniref:Uncharacterized protein n=1 Tax=Dorcoceras hygrometricum TaxID=472368 RepID=A0A2Z7D0Q4_9LAMI|nr:hypothetical protein F511_07033 [Dorcoceras hygrometricum]
MAAVADVRMGETAKLGSKDLWARNPMFFARSKKRDSAEECKELKQGSSSSSNENLNSAAERGTRNEDAISDSVTFLLMDRFAPC